MINLHAIANRVIRAVHPNDDFIVIRCTGFVNNNGLLTHYYGDCEKVSAQLQTLNGDEQSLNAEIMQNEISRKLFISVQGMPITAGRFDTQEGATFLYHPKTGDFWKVYNINEDFNKNHWVTAFVSLLSYESTPRTVIDGLKNSPYGGLLTTAQREPNNGESSEE